MNSTLNIKAGRKQNIIRQESRWKNLKIGKINELDHRWQTQGP